METSPTVPSPDWNWKRNAAKWQQVVWIDDEDHELVNNECLQENHETREASSQVRDSEFPHMAFDQE